MEKCDQINNCINRSCDQLDNFCWLSDDIIALTKRQGEVIIIVCHIIRQHILPFSLYIIIIKQENDYSDMRQQ